MLDAIKRYFSSSKSIFLVVVFLIVVFLSDPLKIHFDNWFVASLFSKIRSNALDDLIIILFAMGIVVNTYRNIKSKELISNDWLMIALFFMVLYVACRLTNQYEYVPLKIYNPLKYADVFVLLSLSLFVIKGFEFVEEVAEPIYHDKPFLVDIPISTSTQDLLNRKKFAARIAKKVQSKPKVANAGALAIGITGEWGSGKTSFSNLVKDSLKKENRIIIEFNPWRSSSPEKIIEDFFELLIAELKVYDHNLSSSIYTYAKTLTKVDENIFTKSAQAISDLFESSSKNEIYKKIDQSICHIKKQIIIFIDDLDRLDKKEITEVLRIIRNTANFNNLVYVVAYDKSYVLEAVKSFNESNYTAFLEKIFQFEFALPLYRAEIMRTYLKNLLKSDLPENLHEEIEWVVESRAYRGINFTSELIQNHRSAIRLANAIVFEISDVIDDVFFYDFYLLQLLKLRYSTVFNALFENSNLFLISENNDKDVFLRLRLEKERSIDDNELHMRNLSKFILNRDKKTEENPDSKEVIFHNFIIENRHKLSLSEWDIPAIEGIIAELLNPERSINSENKNQRYKAFVRFENFYKYFAFGLLDGEIPAKDFEVARRLPYEQYREKIDEWDSEGKLGAFIDRIYKIESFEGKLEFENQVKALFDIARKYFEAANYHGFDYSFLLKMFDLPKSELEDSKPALYETKDEFADFLNSILEDEKFPPNAKQRLLALMLAKGEHFPFSPEILAEKSMKNLEDYMKENSELSSEFWDLYHNTKIWKEDHYRAVHNPESVPLMAAFNKKHIKSCDLGRFIMQIDPGSEYYYLDEARRVNIFKDFDEFENWLSTAENIDRNSECYKEFIQFYAKNRKDLPNGTKWDFQHITPDRWQSHG